MPYRRLDRFRRDYPQLAGYVQELEAVLERGSSDALEPALLAQQLGVDEGLALSLLMAFQDAGILAPRYDVYCPSDEFIASFPSLAEIPSRVYCPFDDLEHERDECTIQLVFVPLHSRDATQRTASTRS
jgi:hypothetical protein